MFVSVKDRENTVVKQRISQLIEPIRRSQVRSERKVLQDLFPSEQGTPVAQQLSPRKFNQCIGSARSLQKLSTTKNCHLYDAVQLITLQRQLSQTKAVAKAQENSLHIKVETLQERLEYMQQQNSSLLSQIHRYEERIETLQTTLYDFQKKMVERQLNNESKSDNLLKNLQDSLHEKQKQLLQLRTLYSKFKYDTTSQCHQLQINYDNLMTSSLQKEQKWQKETMQLQEQLSMCKNKLEHCERDLAINRQQTELLKNSLANQKVKSQNMSVQNELLLSKMDSLRNQSQQLHQIRQKYEELQMANRLLERRCTDLDDRLEQKTNKINQVVQSYEIDIEALRKRLAMDVRRDEDAGYISTERGLRREVDSLRAEISAIKERHFYEMSLKEEKISLVHRQLTQRDQEIQRLVAYNHKIQILQQSISQRPSPRENSTRLPTFTNEQHFSNSENLKQRCLITQLQLQVNNQHNHIQSLETEIQLKSTEVEELSRLMESQSNTIRQLSKINDQKEHIICQKLRTISKLEMEVKKQLTTIVDFQQSEQQEEQFKNECIRKITLDSQQNMSHLSNSIGKHFYRLLHIKLTQFESSQKIISELTHTNRYLREANAKHVQELKSLTERIQQLIQNKSMNEQLIIKIEEQSKIGQQQIREEMTREYEILYEKYIKYRRILQREKEKKEMQKAILKDNNKFNDLIVEKCKEIIR